MSEPWQGSRTQARALTFPDAAVLIVGAAIDSGLMNAFRRAHSAA